MNSLTPLTRELVVKKIKLLQVPELAQLLRDGTCKIAQRRPKAVYDRDCSTGVVEY